MDSGFSESVPSSIRPGSQIIRERNVFSLVDGLVLTSVPPRVAARHEARDDVHDQRKGRKAGHAGNRNSDDVRILHKGIDHYLQDQAPNARQKTEKPLQREKGISDEWILSMYLTYNATELAATSSLRHTYLRDMLDLH